VPWLASWLHKLDLLMSKIYLSPYYQDELL